ncbi:hypothetical protein, partial [Pseudomonas sp. P5_A2_2]
YGYKNVLAHRVTLAFIGFLLSEANEGVVHRPTRCRVQLFWAMTPTISRPVDALARDPAYGARPIVKMALIFHTLFVIIPLMTQRIRLPLALAHLKCTHASEKHESAKDAEP